MAVVNPAVLNALTLQYARTRADLDDQQNRYRINYNSALDKMRRGYNDSALSNSEGFSDRGMLHSGASMAAGTKLRDTYNRAQSDAGLSFNTNLATLARRRLEAKQQYDTEKLLASLGFTTK